MKRQSTRIPQSFPEAERSLWHALEHICNSAQERTANGEIIYVSESLDIIREAIANVQNADWRG